MDLPLKWVETHLSRIETPCAVRFRELDAIGTGRVMDAQLKRDLAVFLGLQRTRTPSQRECSMVIIKGPTSAKKEVYRLLNPTLSEIDLAAACRPKYTDDKLEAIHLMISDVRNVLGRALYKRRWAIYETAKPIITCDDPVVALAGPPAPRASFVGFPSSAAVLYPIDPFHLLVLLRSDLQHRGPFQLNEAETDSINLEIAAAATKTTFERIGDAIATTLEVPRRDSVAPLSDEDFARMDRTTAIGILLNKGTPRSRWSDAAQAPDWPVPRWYA